MGIRSRGLFSSRNQLTFVSQEQELYGTYDPEDITPVDKKPEDVSSPPLLPSLYQKPAAVPSSAPLWEDTQSPVPLTQPLPTLRVEPTGVRLAPNRRLPSPERRTSLVAKLPLNYAERFNNPATRVSRLRQSLRSPIGAWIPRTLGSPPLREDHARADDYDDGARDRSYLELGGGRSRW